VLALAVGFNPAAGSADRWAVPAYRSALALVGFSARDGWFFLVKKNRPRVRVFFLSTCSIMHLEKEKTRCGGAFFSAFAFAWVLFF